MPNTERLQRLRAEGFAVSTLAIPESAECLSERAGISLAADGWFLPTSGIVNPAALIRAELNGIPCFYGQEVVEIVPEGNFVRVFTTTTEYSARSVVLANAHDVARLPVASYLPVEPVHGEVLVGGCTLSPRLPICGKGFVLPLSSQECLVGARYRHGFPLEPDPTALQEMAERIGVTIHSVHTLRQSYRCSTHDKCPFAGELLDYADLIAQKESILFKRSGKATPCFFDRLFVSVGYGSRGLLLCSLTAEILTEKIVQGRTHPLASLTHPARLTHRLLHRSS
jgi:glycine/D-amino acid oxidase-like deaminating enzyme